MNLSTIADFLWGDKAKLRYLLIGGALLLFLLLGAREIWTQEHRWADIVMAMFGRHDFFHPFLDGQSYYDKPLLSYWLIAFASQVLGGLTTWALRIPSALAGLVALWSIYRIGTQLKDKKLGMLSGWLLLTTFYFVFWARTSSADMLNLAGILLAIAWYFEKRNQTTTFDYAVFFMIVAITSLCKGLVGAVIPLLAVFIDMCLQGSLRAHLRLPLLIATLPAIIVYLLPFWLSSHIGGTSYSEDGLYLVYRENILRYFHPFDHKDPIYTYFIYLPIYLLPGAFFFFLPALASVFTRFRRMGLESKWIVLTLTIVFLFFTLSGSRRSYYVIPVVPFAILFTADWILSDKSTLAKRRLWAAFMIIASFFILLVTIDLLPEWYYSQYGSVQFTEKVKTIARKEKPWYEWRIVMLDAESKLNFYLQHAASIEKYDLDESIATGRRNTLQKSNPFLADKTSNTIYVTRKSHLGLLQPLFTGYRIEEAPTFRLPRFLQQNEDNTPIAFIPIK